MKNGKAQKQKVFLGIVTVLLFMLSGCIPGTTNTSTPHAAQGNFEDLPPVSSTVGNYEDIEIPADMKYSTKKSMSIRTESFRGGIIHYSGRIEMYSLKEFIISSMKTNKWKLAGEVSSENVILAFTKPNKTCMMKIENNGAMSDTTLTMYVTVDVAAAASLNAFGEPVR
ncbi:MAG: hypothetical protein K9K37_00405 [Desulfocapsa sp.]|nr:hypothetical protein [Desulfocapsa sp.]